MAWRAAYSLQTLKAQLDSAYPGWLFLGYLGDAAHASVPSDHNPNAAGVVCALDIGPGGGLQIHTLADNLAAHPHPDLKYVISNRRIAEWQYGFKWRTYSGSDPHDTHIHVSVGRGDDGKSVQPYDDKNNWNVKGEDMVDEKHLQSLFGHYRNRQATMEEILKFAGHYTYGQMIDILASGSEHDKLVHEIAVGVNAVKDDWAGQIANLQKQVKGTVLESGTYLVK